MKYIVSLFFVSLLVLSSCETRDIEKLKDQNTTESINYHISIMEYANLPYSGKGNLERDLRKAAYKFCKENRCMQQIIKVYFNDPHENPIEIEIGSLLLDEFAYDEIEFIDTNSIELEVLHGLIYEQDKPLFEKGSQIRGKIRKFSHSEISNIETLTFITFRKEN